MSIEILFTGTCWNCGIEGFKKVLPDVADPDSAIDVLTWYRRTSRELVEEGWHFLQADGGEDGEGEKLRAYCRHCWGRTEG